MSFTASGTARADRTSVASGTAVATDHSVASGSSRADDHSVASGRALALRGSVASGCSTAIDGSTASGACAPGGAGRLVVTAKPGAGTGAGAGTATGRAASGQLARTGTDVDGLAAAAVLSTALGGVFLALGRRRSPKAVD